MLITFRKKYFLKIADIYFSNNYEKNNIKNVDIIIYVQVSKSCINCKKFFTLHIDLSKEKDILFSDFKKNNKYEIKRAMNKDNLRLYILKDLSEDDIIDFSNFYNLFAKNKKLTKCNLNKLKVLKKNNALIISCVKSENDKPLCYHAYVLDSNRARLLYSCSLFRLNKDSSKKALIGRANRYLHWCDIIYFKNIGLKIYDFGGLALDNKNIQKTNIDRFKKGFGGEVITEYKYSKGISFLGKIILNFHKFFRENNFKFYR